MDTMDYEEDEDDEAAGEALTVPLLDAFSGLQGECDFLIICYCTGGSFLLWSTYSIVRFIYFHAARTIH